MKIAKFTVERSQVDHLIHNLKALIKVHDKPGSKDRFVACNLLERKPSGIKKFFGKDTGLRIIVQIERKNYETGNS